MQSDIFQFEEGMLRVIHTEKINIAPFEMKYLLDYYHGFNHEITKFQWPDPFEKSDDAKNMLSEFLDEMEREETLLFSILSKNDKFLGSVEVHGLAGECPELGVWIIESEQNKGYAYTALREVLNYVSAKYGKESFFYEADIRNISSTKLLHKFRNQYEIMEQGFEKITTDSGKMLELQGYILKAKNEAKGV
ncbi:MAG: GNAT family N-acetyltransferase [Lachnospiraceae bacterium]|jgi:RimJ/RimL family protein N-acetyltransferase|nr:GNAT family N-acetyltransferase [Lachnospiraceae bacterium]